MPLLAVLQVALEGIESILKLGEKNKKASGETTNEYAEFVEEAGGMDKLQMLQSDANDEIYQSAVRILELYLTQDIIDQEEDYEDEDDRESLFPLAGITGDFDSECSDSSWGWDTTDECDSSVGAESPVDKKQTAEDQDSGASPACQHSSSEVAGLMAPLIEMGFDVESASRALAFHGGDVQAAAEALIVGQFVEG